MCSRDRRVKIQGAKENNNASLVRVIKNIDS